MKRLTLKAAIAAMLVAAGLAPAIAGGIKGFGNLGGGKSNNTPSFGNGGGFSGGNKAPSFAPPKVNTPSFSGPKFSPPKVNTPSFNPPKINPPKVNSSVFTPPKLNTPTFTPPKGNSSVFTPPKVNTPTFTPPKPTIPKVNVSTVTPTVKTPTFNLPNANVPKVNIPKVTVKPPTIPVLGGKSGTGFNGGNANTKLPPTVIGARKVEVRKPVNTGNLGGSVVGGTKPGGSGIRTIRDPELGIVRPPAPPKDNTKKEVIKSLTDILVGTLPSVIDSGRRRRDRVIVAPPTDGFVTIPQPGPVAPPVFVPTPVELAPQPVVSQPTPPAPPVNVVEKPKSQPARNTTVSSIKGFNPKGLSLTDADVQTSKDALDESAQKNFDELQQADAQATDALISQLQNDVKGSLTPDQQTALDNALKANDAEAVKQILATAGVTGDKAQMLVGLTDTRKQLGNLADVFANGGSAADIAAASDAYLKSKSDLAALLVSQNAITQADADANLAALTGRMNDIVAAKSGSEVLAAVLNGTLPAGPDTFPLPTDDLMAAWMPCLPAGQLLAVDGDMVFIGTGPGGECTAGFVTPSECGIPVQEGEPIADAAAGEQPETLLTLSPEAAMAFNYSLNDNPYSMGPGQEQSLNAGPWTIAFDRGRGFGEARYTLSAGHYEAARTDRGWDVFARKSQVTLDNSANPNAFSLLIDGQNQTVAAGTAVEMESSMPIVVEFDNGKGQIERKRLSTGSYLVGINPQAGTLDLYDALSIDDGPDLTRPDAPAPVNAVATVAEASAPVAAPRTIRPPKRLTAK